MESAGRHGRRNQITRRKFGAPNKSAERLSSVSSPASRPILNLSSAVGAHAMARNRRLVPTPLYVLFPPRRCAGFIVIGHMVPFHARPGYRKTRARTLRPAKDRLDIPPEVESPSFGRHALARSLLLSAQPGRFANKNSLLHVANHITRPNFSTIRPSHSCRCILGRLMRAAVSSVTTAVSGRHRVRRCLSSRFPRRRRSPPLLARAKKPDSSRPGMPWSRSADRRRSRRATNPDRLDPGWQPR
jgi:hypothetical protein